MYLSRLRLDTQRRSTMKALNAPNLFHGAIEHAFTGQRTRKLWRVDTLGGNRYLLLLSGEKPDLTAAAEQFGLPGVPSWETKACDSLLRRIKEGTLWHFRLTANPTKCCVQPGQTSGIRGTVHAHITAEYQKQWLLERSEKHGFSLRADTFQTVESEWKIFRKGSERNRVTLLAVTYEGLLRVTNAKLFCKTLTGGIGRGKAYGMGLLTVVRPVEGANV